MILSRDSPFTDQSRDADNYLSRDMSPETDRDRQRATSINVSRRRSTSCPALSQATSSETGMRSRIQERNLLDNPESSDLTHDSEDYHSTDSSTSLGRSHPTPTPVRGSSSSGLPIAEASISSPNFNQETLDRSAVPASSPRVTEILFHLPDDAAFVSQDQQLTLSSTEQGAGPTDVLSNEVLSQVLRRSSDLPTEPAVINNNPSRARIEFQPLLRTQQSPGAIAQSVFSRVRKPVKTTDDWIYILQSPDYPEYVKIGVTTRPIKQRLNELVRCSKLELKLVDDLCYSRIPNCKQLEKLIQKDLANERCYFYCSSCQRSPSRSPRRSSSRNLSKSPSPSPSMSADTSPDRSRSSSPSADRTTTPDTTPNTTPSTSPDRSLITSPSTSLGTKHGEWFKISAQKASERVELWRGWMRQVPYSRRHELKRDFQRRVDYCERVYDLGKEDREGQRWKAFMAPFCMDD